MASLTSMSGGRAPADSTETMMKNNNVYIYTVGKKRDIRNKKTVLN